MSLPDFANKICDLSIANDRVTDWKSANESVVFTNGVFDLIHPGHVIYLSQAKALGSKLIVGINSDSSTRALAKGANRPIKDEQSRALILAALASIDMVIMFNDPTPISIIETLLPNILVKGGDYSIDQIVGAEVVQANGGMVKTLAFVEGYSTTAIEQKILGKS